MLLDKGKWWVVNREVMAVVVEVRGRGDGGGEDVYDIRVSLYPWWRHEAVDNCTICVSLGCFCVLRTSVSQAAGGQDGKNWIRSRLLFPRKG